MIRAGIISMQKVPNYGSFLQAYALKQLLLKAGADSVDFIDIKKGKQIVRDDWVSRLQSRLKNLHLSKVVFKLQTRKYLKIRNARFIPFYEYFKNDNPSDTVYDLIVIGSDEVFNCCQPSSWGFSRQLLGEVDNGKRVISYAASFGSTTMQEIEHYHVSGEVSECLRLLSATSVRDDNSSQIVKVLTGSSPLRHLDPVLIYGYKEELKRNVDVVIPKEDYMIVYSYAGRIDDKKEIKSIKRFAKQHGLKLYSLFCNYSWCDGEIIPEHPLQVPAIFNKSKFAVTDTFHGTIFSIISHTKFVTFVRYNNIQKLSSLLDGVGLIDRIVKTPDSLAAVMEKNINYNEVEGLLEKERNRTATYLSQYLDH